MAIVEWVVPVFVYKVCDLKFFDINLVEKNLKR